MGDSTEELRAMLRSTDAARATPLRAIKADGASDLPLDELASLINSLDIDLGTPMKSVRSRTGGDPSTGLPMVRAEMVHIVCFICHIYLISIMSRIRMLEAPCLHLYRLH